MAERIEVIVRTTPYYGAHHMYFLYTRSDGAQFTASAFRTGNGTLLQPFGTIDTKVSAWGPQSYEWNQGTIVGTQVVKFDPNSLATTWANVVSCFNKIDAANIGYSPLGPNSNATVNTCALQTGLDPITIDDDLPGGIFTPSGDMDLRIHTPNLFAPPEPPAKTPLDYFRSIFGGGGGGFDGGGYGGGTGGGGFVFGGTSGYWREFQVSDGAGGPTFTRYNWVEARATRIRPVALDLDGDGIELTSAHTSPGFDFMAEGYTKTMGWFTGGDALLVHDGNGNNRVDDGTELSFVHHAPGSTSDLVALRVFDSNGNGWLDPGDTTYAQFKLWRDFNFNGASDPGELTSLQALGVSAINLQPSALSAQVAGNTLTGAATFTRTDGSTGTAYDVAFEAFSRGTRLLHEDQDWAIISTDSGEEIAVQKNSVGMYIGNLGTFEVRGDTRTGYQFGDGADTVYANSLGSRPFYLDTGGGNDYIDLSQSYFGSVIKTGSGTDTVIGTLGNDVINTGPGYYDVVRDWAGDEYYVIQSDYSTIYDYAGKDAVIFERLRFGDVEFWIEGTDIVVSALSGNQRHWFKEMLSSADMGVETVMFEDRTLSRDDLVALAFQGGHRDYGAPFEDLGVDTYAGASSTFNQPLNSEHIV